MKPRRRVPAWWPAACLLVPVLAVGVAARQLPPHGELEHGAAAVRLLMERGAHAEADREATRLAARANLDGDEPVTPASVPVLAVLVEARLLNGKAGDRTLELARRAIASSERLTGTGSLESASAWLNLATLRLRRGEFAEALTLHERALAIRARLAPPGSAAIAGSLEHLAQVEILLERFDSARKRIDQALTIREAAAATAPLPLAGALELRATWLRYTGDYAGGLAALERARTIRAGAVPDVPHTTTLLDLRGDLRFLQGDIERARQDWTQGLTLAERTLDPEHPAIATFLRKLALAADAFGHRSDARALLSRAVAIGRRLPRCHPESAGLLNDSAISAERDGDFTQARSLYRQHLQRLEACHSNANWTGTAVHNLGTIAMKMGDLTEAERLHERAVAVWSRGLGARHPHVARALDALAEVVAARGQPARARQIYEKALGIRRGSEGRATPDVAWTLTNLARAVAGLGDLALASRYVDEAIGIYRAQGAFDEPDHLARALALEGTIRARRGDFAGARDSLRASLAERTRIFGPGHPLLAESGVALARVQWLAGARGPALATALEAERIGREHLQHTIRYLPERQALAYAAQRPAALGLVVSLAASGAGADVEAAFDAVIRSRGVVLGELASRARTVRADSPRVAALIEAASRARQRLANLVVRSMQEPVPRPMLDQARADKEAAEQRLAEERVEASAGPSAGFAQIRTVLAGDTALISFVKYGHEPAAPPAGATTPPAASYAAFVLHRGRVSCVRLGPAAAIEALVRRWRDEAIGQSARGRTPGRRSETAYRRAGTRLREVVWDPLLPRLDGASRLFVVPDGLLNVLNVAALPHPRGAGYIVEDERLVHYLSVEREIAAGPAEPMAAGLLAVGGVAFGTGAAAGTTPRHACSPLGQASFTTLPGTAGEVAEIGRLWSQAMPPDITLLTGAAATEAAVKRALAGRRVVHLATHGFVMDQECRAPAGTTRAVGGLARVTAADAAALGNPLLLAGLAFAGANRLRSSKTDAEDGILTAEEIAGLDLSGTEWAVLSACDTGLGEIRAGEGVFGLRRAFHIAGARTVIMSLWSVDDQATRAWMRALYEGRLSRQLSTADAVRHASLSVLRDRREAGQSTHPFYWAAFVAAGDWR